MSNNCPICGAPSGVYCGHVHESNEPEKKELQEPTSEVVRMSKFVWDNFLIGLDAFDKQRTETSTVVDLIRAIGNHWPGPKENRMNIFLPPEITPGGTKKIKINFKICGWGGWRSCTCSSRWQCTNTIRRRDF